MVRGAKASAEGQGPVRWCRSERANRCPRDLRTALSDRRSGPSHGAPSSRRTV
jgi:hypothetical protein